ncbi:hypothetical protein [Methylomonas rosea]|uniref:Uncharacterized protein n=1 Tax=Methylomonas rosea TaxID=2952227 RepID=A0ABT1TYA9_9GAMM|nr:hypothetical protein [Methylomonas sp. WSC-7]MCQ8119744.1 hypothetical protein [Methylomonas sp. WSC-7]
MKILAVLIFAGIAYGFALFLIGIIKELAQFAVEAWRDVEIRR